MKKDEREIQHKFTESYIKLCMTEGIKAEFGRPFAKGQYCIYKDDPKKICRVELSGEKTYIYYEEGGAEIETSDLTWIPTIAEIRQNFGIEDAGFENQYKNFTNYPDPDYYGYSPSDLNQYPSEEERWLLYAMWLSRPKIFTGNNWIAFKKR
jgi:hypothetical protein